MFTVHSTLLLTPTLPCCHLKTTSNISRRFARNNSSYFSLSSAKTDTYRNSFFIRTVSDWNDLTEELVSAKSMEEI